MMADDKKGRDKQARDEERRQQERDIASELERGDEPEPPIDATELGDFEAKVDTVEFPATGTEVITAVGTHEIELAGETYTIEDLVPNTETETFESPTAVRMQVQRPTVAAAMKDVLTATTTLSNTTLSGSQRNAYERTFTELRAIDPDDDDEGIHAIRDWILEQIHETGKLPGSRGVRRQAAKFCRANGYQIGNNEWLGV